MAKNQKVRIFCEGNDHICCPNYCLKTIYSFLLLLELTLCYFKDAHMDINFIAVTYE